MDSTQTSVLHSFDSAHKRSLWLQVIVIFIAAVVLGVLTGYILAPRKIATTGSSTPQASQGTTGSNMYSKGQIIGSADTGAFKDSAEGILKAGGIEGEGEFHLVRPGGDSQNVYLISSSVDLSKLVDKKIKVWGATQSAKHAGWLMDVGRVEILE